MITCPGLLAFKAFLEGGGGWEMGDGVLGGDAEGCEHPWSKQLCTIGS